jgi:hypothetical protein
MPAKQQPERTWKNRADLSTDAQTSRKKQMRFVSADSRWRARFQESNFSAADAEAAYSGAA